MKRLLSFVLVIALALSMLLAMTACSQNPPETTKAPATTAPTTPATTVPTATYPDMGGMKFILGNWWGAAEYEPKEPETAWEQICLEYHDMIQAEMNFTFEEIGLQNMGTYSEVLINSILQSDPVCSAFMGEHSYVTAMASQGLLYDLSKLDAFDFENDPKWNKDSIEYYTINGAIYGARPSHIDPGDYLLWNKRLFQEAGLDPDLPYQLQAEGKWDWEHFEELCEKLTKDIDNDGVTDIYGFGGNDGTIMNMGIYSNGARFVDRDENGKLIDGTLNPAFEEGMNFIVSLLQKGYCHPFLDGETWDSLYTDFANGKIAMTVGNWQIQSYWMEMADDYGAVMYPAGPKGSNCTSMVPTAICIPSCLDEETANKVATVINAWYDTNKLPEHDELGVSFKDDFYWLFRDEKAVDETVYKIMTGEDTRIMEYYYLVPDFDYWDYVVTPCKLTRTPAEIIEILRTVNDAAIRNANTLLGYN